MAPDNDGHEANGGGDRRRILLIAVAVLGTILASALLPALSITGTADSPASGIFPEEPFQSGDGADAGNGSGGGSQPGFGALDPGDRTGVGGAVTDTANPFRSQESTVHFLVRSSNRSYWRTAAYVNYTGNGWTSPASSVPLDGPIDADGARGQTVAYEVELRQEASGLPTVYRPRSVSGVADARVTDRLGVRVPGSVPAGTTYTGLSHSPPAQPALLRASSSQDYPRAVEARYTNDTGVSDRLRRFTANLTASANGPYETAATIEAWLESNKDYALNASHGGSAVATSFVFGMDRGYCEYYATAMTAMLRSQGIPARYVIGYSTGEAVGENTYRVRELNAHAWVEVYFADVGWVRFDPTPGGARLARERTALAAQGVQTDYNHSERGSPGERFSAGDPVVAPPSVGEDTPPENDSERLTVELNRSAVPGVTVEVLVRQGSTPAVGRTVAFNGEQIGVTDSNGRVTGTVPWARELRVAIAVTGVDISVPSLAPSALQHSAVQALAIERSSSGSEGRSGGVDAASVQFETERTATIPIRTNASIAVIGEAVPGNRVTVAVTVDGVPIPNASVRIDGRAIARTDEAGRAALTLPAAAGNVTLRAERAPVTGERRLTLEPLAVAVEPALPVALPRSPATVQVTRAGDPVANASVAVGGHAVGRTAPDGTVDVLLPFAGSASVTADKFGVSAATRIGGMFGNLVLVVAIVVALMTALVAVRRRGGVSVRNAAARLPGALRAGRRAVLGAILAIATVDTSALARTRAQVGRRLSGLRGEAPTPSEAGANEPGAAVSPSTRRIRRAWHRFLGHTGVVGSGSRTPGEVARHAIEEEGLPRAAVEDLRDAVREVEYGDRDPGERTERVERALGRIDRAREAVTDSDGERVTDGGGDA